MQLISWNVNGLRAAIRNGFADFIAAKRPEVLCLQEIKATPDVVDLSFLGPEYQHYWNCAEKKGYSGTAIFTTEKPLSDTRGIGIATHDKEGRVLTLEFHDYFLVNVYTPNSQRGLARLDYRQQWDRAFLKYLRKLEETKPVVFCGDLNVAHTEIDLANPKSNRKNAGFTDEERAGFTRLQKAGFIDTFREFEKDGGHYSWWTYRSDARARNIGWRLDYWCISKSLRPRLASSRILPEVMGSDHCPILMELA